MKRKFLKRRNFLKSSIIGLSALSFPNLVLSNSTTEYDVIVIGAGAAGLAATSELRRAGGKSVICLEASDKIGGRVITDAKTFNEPYDTGALWLSNGDSNPFKIFGENQTNLKLYKERSEEIYTVYNGNKKTSQENELWKLYDESEATIAKTRKDIAPIEVIKNQDHRWFNTAHLIIGPWEMGKDFSDYSCQDFNYEYDVISSSDWHCEEGFGTLLTTMHKDTPVQLKTVVEEIDWSGTGVKVVTNKGIISGKKCVITVSNGVLNSGQIKFTPNLPLEKQEAFSKISMGHSNRVALKFKKLFKKKSKDSYIYYKVDDDVKGSPAGIGITVKPSNTNLCICDFGGKFGLEISKNGSEAAIDFALNELIKIFGSKIKKDLIQSSFSDWSSNKNTYGAWASAEPGAFKYREILKQEIGERIYFAGEATANDWGTAAGAHNRGIEIAKKLIST